MSASLILRDICFKQSKQQIIFPTSISLSQEARVAIVGLNGAGKTTLLKLIVGELKPTSGAVEFSNGRSLSQLVATSQLGYQAADMAALSELTATEYLQLCCMLKNYSPTVTEHNIQSVSKLWELEKILSMPVKKLSQGNLRKLSIAQAFLGDPDIIVLDEPTQALDPIEQERFTSNLLGLKNQLCLFTSHHVDEAVRTAEDVLMMHQGSIVASLKFSDKRSFWVVSQELPEDIDSTLKAELTLSYRGKYNNLYRASGSQLNQEAFQQVARKYNLETSLLGGHSQALMPIFNLLANNEL